MLNQKRVVIDFVSPQINNGEFFIKRVINEVVNIDAHILADGHDVIGASVLYKHEGASKWQESRMQLIINDEWKASFIVEKQGFYSYRVQGWIDYALNWQHGIERKIDDNQHVKSELLEGVAFLKDISKKSTKKEKEYLDHLASIFLDSNTYKDAIKEAVSDKLHNIFLKYPTKILANTSKDYEVYVDRFKARFSTWYEFFPRSASETE
ncbi:MAG: maltotransferase domain-containing protein, partial [Melioribacteraceae bacterium]|nr:maltotransferase domain-containing protein [Melioribacteraceae bacterium]